MKVTPRVYWSIAEIPGHIEITSNCNLFIQHLLKMKNFRDIGFRLLILFLSVTGALLITAVSGDGQGIKEIEKAEISLNESGGIGGWLFTSITVKPDGTAINDKNKPPLSIRLTGREHGEILAHAGALMPMDIKVRSTMMMSDAVGVKLSIKGAGGAEKIIRLKKCFDGYCSQVEPAEAWAHINALVDALRALAGRIEQES
jgi:hypothetical protein